MSELLDIDPHKVQNSFPKMSLKDEFNVNHNRYNNAIHDLFQSLDLTLQNKPGTTPVEIMKELIQIDIELKETMKRIKEHQEIQTINEQLESEILKSKTCITESVASMDKMGNEMQALLKEAKKSLNSYQSTIKTYKMV